MKDSEKTKLQKDIFKITEHIYHFQSDVKHAELFKDIKIKPKSIGFGPSETVTESVYSIQTNDFSFTTSKDYGIWDFKINEKYNMDYTLFDVLKSLKSIIIEFKINIILE